MGDGSWGGANSASAALDGVAPPLAGVIGGHAGSAAGAGGACAAGGGSFGGGGSGMDTGAGVDVEVVKALAGVVVAVGLAGLGGALAAAAVSAVVVAKEGVGWRRLLGLRQRQQPLLHPEPPLSAREWHAAFDESTGRPTGQLLHAIGRVRLGGCDNSIRGEVWPFLLGLFDASSTASERETQRAARRQRYNELRRAAVHVGSLAVADDEQQAKLEEKKEQECGHRLQQQQQQQQQRKQAAQESGTASQDQGRAGEVRQRNDPEQTDDGRGGSGHSDVAASVMDQKGSSYGDDGVFSDAVAVELPLSPPSAGAAATAAAVAAADETSTAATPEDWPTVDLTASTESFFNVTDETEDHGDDGGNTIAAASGAAGDGDSGGVGDRGGSEAAQRTGAGRVTSDIDTEAQSGRRDASAKAALEEDDGELVEADDSQALSSHSIGDRAAVKKVSEEDARSGGSSSGGDLNASWVQAGREEEEAQGSVAVSSSSSPAPSPPRSLPQVSSSSSSPSSSLAEPQLHIPELFRAEGGEGRRNFLTWRRIMRLDAVRMNAQWVPFCAYAQGQGRGLSSEDFFDRAEAVEAAEAVGLPDPHGHLSAAQLAHGARLVSILEPYAVHDPDIGYCQGMSDLLSPFVALLPEDADAFWAFAQFMQDESSAASARHNFRTDEVGIRKQLAGVANVLAVCDPEIYEHLSSLGAEDCMFVYRMVVVRLRRELSFGQTLQLWEVLWAEAAAAAAAGAAATAAGAVGGKVLPGVKFYSCPGVLSGRGPVPPRSDFFLFVVAATVAAQRDEVLACQGMDEVLLLCNSMAGEIDLWAVIGRARDMVAKFCDAHV